MGSQAHLSQTSPHPKLLRLEEMPACYMNQLLDFLDVRWDILAVYQILSECEKILKTMTKRIFLIFRIWAYLVTDFLEQNQTF